MKILEIKDLSKSFKSKKILNKISFSINKGDIVGIVGKSGQGKTVLIKILIGFFKKDEGQISLNGLEQKEIGFSMQNNSLYGDLTIKQNWIYFSKLNKIKKKIYKKRIDLLIEELNLKEFENTLIKKLSGGTKKRVDIGCALLTDPKIVILDEPFSGLDPKLVDEISRIILKLNRNGATIIISSHRIPELSRIVNRIFLLNNKKIIEKNKGELNYIYR